MDGIGDLRIVGLVLTGFSALAYRSLGTNKGGKWLNRVIDWATKRYYTQGSYPTQRSAIEALRNFKVSKREGVLTKEDDGFNEALSIIEELDGEFEEFDSDEVTKLERTNYEVDEAREREVSDWSSESFIDAVMEDGSRKIATSVRRISTEETLRRQRLSEQKERDTERFRNRIEDGIKGSLIMIGLLGAGLLVASADL